MAYNLIMPRIIFGINSVQNKPVINDDWAKVSLGLTIIKGFTILSDFI